MPCAAVQSVWVAPEKEREIWKLGGRECVCERAKDVKEENERERKKVKDYRGESESSRKRERQRECVCEGAKDVEEEKERECGRERKSTKERKGKRRA